jgi:hypothetical protein
VEFVIDRSGSGTGSSPSELFSFLLLISFHSCSIITHTHDPLAAAAPLRQSHLTTTIIKFARKITFFWGKKNARRKKNYDTTAMISPLLVCFS